MWCSVRVSDGELNRASGAIHAAGMTTRDHEYAQLVTGGSARLMRMSAVVEAADLDAAREHVKAVLRSAVPEDDYVLDSSELQSSD